MMDDGGCRFLISISDLRDWDRGFTAQLIASPMELLPALEAAVKDVRTVRRTAHCAPRVVAAVARMPVGARPFSCRRLWTSTPRTLTR
ncbi:hypothetical protein EON67_00010 [archaeon]|nr:MAG: hypothetical protein EON67_00010 [archaeon]